MTLYNFESMVMAALVLIVCLVAVAHADAGTNTNLIIDRMAAVDALTEFSAQTGWEVYFQTRTVEHERTCALEGGLEPGPALKAMLKCTHLTYDFEIGRAHV